ncbi:LuxR C-terminal-related transcriptional regulator [Cellulomonas sp. WB94]|uniref:LuxR C-terminal-related transcriptional regulator n=1 Tax=Cellulomonas sp. WB94 TaxID=2173174 RepID=UPI001F5B4AD9|nr:LuxR C-terminal-related transcriptional regulator [Cellulomonas sp. WB94]
MREFLLRSALLDRLTGSLCDAVVGRDDSTQLLVTLERANLFLVALDDQRRWYRYHHLFADVLRVRMLAEQPDLVPLLHQRASRWYESHDSAEEAIRHALAAQDTDRAVHLMELAVPAIRRDRREAILLGWLRALPDDAVRRSPVLSVFFGYMLMVSGDLDAFEARLDDAELALASVPDGSALPWADTEALRSLPATIAVYRASIAQARGDVAGTAEHARRALGLAGPDDHLARGSAAAFLGLAAWADGDVTTALEIFALAVTSLHAAGNLVDELSSTVIQADMWITAGRPSTARRLYDSALQVAEEHRETTRRATPDLHVGLSELDYDAGDLAAAKRHLESAAALVEGAATTESRHRWFIATARTASAEGDPQEAIALLDTAARLYQPGFFPDVRPVAALRARVGIAQGHLTEAAAWAHERGLSTTDDPWYLREFDHLTLVRLLIARHRAQPEPGALGEALGLLARLGAAAEASGRVGSVVESQMLSALAHDAQGDRPQALVSLVRAWAQAAEPDSYVRLFLDEGSPMEELLRAAEQQGVSGGHARRLLDLGAATASDATDPRQRPRAVGPLSERELQVLRLLDSELNGPEIARELFITLNTLRSHTKSIFTKLEVTTRRAAVSRAHARGLM